MGGRERGGERGGGERRESNEKIKFRWYQY